MNPGEVWLVRLPSTGTREQAGERPAVVLHDDRYGHGSPLVLAVPFASRLAALRFPATIGIEPTARNGLSVSSVALGFQLRAIDRDLFSRRLGLLEASELAMIRGEIDRLIGRA